jgi:hypothetical protein
MDNPLDKLYKDSLQSGNYKPTEAQWMAAKKGVAASMKSALYLKVFTAVALVSSLTLSGLLIGEYAQKQSPLIQNTEADVQSNKHIALEQAQIVPLEPSNSSTKRNPETEENQVTAVTKSGANSIPSEGISEKSFKQEQPTTRILASIPQIRNATDFHLSPNKEVSFSEIQLTPEVTKLPDFGVVRTPFSSKWEVAFGFDALQNHNNQNISDGKEYAKNAWGNQIGLELKYNLTSRLRVGIAANYAQWAENYCYQRETHVEAYEKNTVSYLDTVGSIRTMLWDGQTWRPIGMVLHVERKQRTEYTRVTKTIYENGQHRNVFHLLQLPVSLSYRLEYQNWTLEPGLAFHLGITAARDGMRMQDGNLTDLNKIKVQAVQNGFSPSLTVGRKIATNVGINARVGYQNQMSNMLTDSNGPLSMNQWTMGARLWFSF